MSYKNQFPGVHFKEIMLQERTQYIYVITGASLATNQATFEN